MKTRQDLIRRALGKLGVLEAGQAPSAEDAKVVDDEIEPVLSELSRRGIYPYGDPDQIEDEAFVHLAGILANSVAGDFGGEADDAKRIRAENRLRVIFAETISYQPLKATYF